MTNALIQSKILIDNDWVRFARQSLEAYGAKYLYYLHAISEPIQIGGGRMEVKLYTRYQFLLVTKNFSFNH